MMMMMMMMSLPHPQAMSVPPTEEKREVLVDCALLIAAVVVKWDLDMFEKR